ncbi:DUF2721 domain-containing protein [Craterilacuibacter sp.]|uniref:DUF2721 domain-containing protein n=1 Tax=Craterilacuibacter sp. TaxID=2870909 RepID=UPI003F371298
MILDLTTPGLLFPAISLLLLAYTNRFLGLAATIRNLYNDYRRAPDPKILLQISSLKCRVRLIQQMQFLGVGSLFLCVIAMLKIYLGWEAAAHYSFGASLALMLASLGLSLRELNLSSDALNILLSDIEDTRHH